MSGPARLFVKKARCIIPRGSKVDDVHQALKKQGMDSGKAARIAQSKTGQALATGKKAKEGKAKGKKK